MWPDVLCVVEHWRPGDLLATYWRPGDLATWRPTGDLLATYWRPLGDRWRLLATHWRLTGDFHWRPGDPGLKEESYFMCFNIIRE